MPEGGSESFLSWLERDRTYSPQPYRQLSTVLRNAGHPRVADSILFESRVRQRSEANPKEIDWWGLWALQLTIGYGYGLGYFLVLFWVLGITLAGWLVLALKVNLQRGQHQEKLGFWYSFDMLLPIVRLRQLHSDIDIDGWPRWYFFFHQMVGYVLTFFVIAGLTGLSE